MASYLPSIVLGILGLLVMTMVMRRVRRSVARFSGAAELTGAQLADESSLLRARTAALGVAMRQQRGTKDLLAAYHQGESAQTGGRP